MQFNKNKALNFNLLEIVMNCFVKKALLTVLDAIHRENVLDGLRGKVLMY